MCETFQYIYEASASMRKYVQHLCQILQSGFYKEKEIIGMK